MYFEKLAQLFKIVIPNLFQSSPSSAKLVPFWLRITTFNSIRFFYLQMVEVMEGSSVFWYPHQRAYCSAFKSWSGYVNAVVDIFFTKETLAISSARGSDRKGKSGDANIPLTPLIIDALVGK